MTKILQMFGMPEVASAHGGALDELIFFVHLLMAALFVGWLAYFVVAIFKFRGGANKKADYVGAKSHMSTYLEIGVAIVEAVLLIGLAIPLWAKAVDHFPAEKDSVVIQVMAQQFKWNAHFAGEDGKWGKQGVQFASVTSPFGLDPKDPAAKDDVTCLSGEEFLVPVNKDVICKISSMDVIHCFKVPAMRVTQDAMPGMMIPIHFKPTKTGKYTITCAQLCGNGHSIMKGDFQVVEPDAYQAWFAKKTEEAKKNEGGGGFE